ncbi:hypothetical protein K438DRAFT_2031115 [Mycena galopus ATCC 62051]|nr:hypothetical protein K438DRAFT_2031115 [Mycena galopus ATCC 62051]
MALEASLVFKLLAQVLELPNSSNTGVYVLAPHSLSDHAGSLVEATKDIYVHLFGDRRDTHPRSVGSYCGDFLSFIEKDEGGELAAIVARCYPIDKSLSVSTALCTHAHLLVAALAWAMIRHVAQPTPSKLPSTPAR